MRIHNSTENETSLATIQTRRPITTDYMISTPGASSSKNQLPDPSTQTPLWDASAHSLSSFSPAWDPSSRTPIHVTQPPREPHWLEHPRLKGVRLRLKCNVPNLRGQYVEFEGVQDNEVKIRDHMDHLLVPFESITAVHPTKPSAHVTPIVGETMGTKYTVRSFEGNRCVVRKTGGKKDRNPQDPSFLISELVEVFA